jgi:hypothetical protein
MYKHLYQLPVSDWKDPSFRLHYFETQRVKKQVLIWPDMSFECKQGMNNTIHKQ